MRTNKQPDPGQNLDGIFRTTSGNSITMSRLADNKAQILITVNSIIISILISLVLLEPEMDAPLVIPGFALMGTNLLSLILILFATRPHLPRGTFTMTEVKQNKVNLLFFGSYFRMRPGEFRKGMLVVLSNPQLLQKMMIRDMYFQGKVVGHKYRLVNRAYSIFMYGLGLSVLSAIVMSLLHGVK